MIFQDILHPHSVDQAAEYLSQGKILFAPTETCYIFAAHALNKKLIENILTLKERSNLPIGILIKNIETGERFAQFNSTAKKLAMKFWPGPLSLVLNKKAQVPDLLTAGIPTLSMRQSPHQFWQNVFKKIDFPITATSANKHQKDEIYQFEQVFQQFSNNELHHLIAVNDGSLPKVKPSTIVDLTTSQPKILRQGPIQEKEILESIKK